MKTDPRPQQVRATHYLENRSQAALFMPMGRGKTWILLHRAWTLYKRGHINTLLVTAPPGVHIQWIYEQATIHLDDGWVGIDLRSKSRQNKQYQERLKTLAQVQDKLLILVSHFELFANKYGQGLVAWFLAKRSCMWVLDESTKIKNHKAKRTKAILSLAQHAKYRYIATGTPVTRGVENIYTQFEFLQRGFLGKSFYGFRARYCILRDIPGAPPGAKQVIGHQNVEELIDRLQPLTFFDKGEAERPVEYTKRYVELTDKQRRLYDEMKAEFVAFYDGKLINLANAAAKLVKMQAVLSGFIYHEDSPTSTVDSNRAISCVDCIEELGACGHDSKVIVWYRFNYDRFLIGAELDNREIQWRDYSGEVKPDQRQANIEDFRYGPVPVLLMQLQAGAYGLNIPEARYNIFFSNVFDAELRWQAEERSRPGQRCPTLNIDLVARDTMDLHLLRVLRERRNLKNLVESLLEEK